jgi:hypothetical protein
MILIVFPPGGHVAGSASSVLAAASMVQSWNISEGLIEEEECCMLTFLVVADAFEGLRQALKDVL